MKSDECTMKKIINLFFSRCLSSKYKRQLYNLTVFSWKIALLIDIIAMILFFFILDSSILYVAFFQNIFSGIFISILTYIVTIVIPERNKIRSIGKIVKDLPDWLSNFSFNENQIYYGNVIEKKLSEILKTINSIDREVGLKRIDNLEENIEVILDKVRILNNKSPYFSHLRIKTHSELKDSYKKLVKIMNIVEGNYWLEPTKYMNYKIFKVD